ncbi:MAG TPA: hypothetical protein VJZ16_05165 [Syntrophales bacterium]|nr:hypothetical protein [Syntrophales bacterium]HLE19258.1 hypothetical protein [Syntrophales bacterium]
MEQKKMGGKIPQESVIYLIACLSGIVIFVLLGLFPQDRTLTGLEKKIAEANLRIEEQNILFPVYQTLKQKTNKKKMPVLPFPAKSELAREQMEQLNANIKEIAGRANVEIVSNMPALNSLAGSPKTMAMEATIRGNFFSFRRFLIGLEGLGYVEHIEDIQIQQNPDAMELKIRFWVARS